MDMFLNILQTILNIFVLMDVNLIRSCSNQTDLVARDCLTCGPRVEEARPNACEENTVTKYLRTLKLFNHIYKKKISKCS